MNCNRIIADEGVVKVICGTPDVVTVCPYALNGCPKLSSDHVISVALTDTRSLDYWRGYRHACRVLRESAEWSEARADEVVRMLEQQ